MTFSGPRELRTTPSPLGGPARKPTLIPQQGYRQTGSNSNPQNSKEVLGHAGKNLKGSPGEP